MKNQQRQHFSLFIFHFLFIAALSAMFAGCFNEPEPAHKTVPAEARLYYSDKGLADLASLRVSLASNKVDTQTDARLTPIDANSTLTDPKPIIDYLNLDRNVLTNVEEVAELTGLKWLRLNDNRLEKLPDLSKLVKLRRIYLKNNKFTAVPETLKDLPALTDIELSGNPITEIPEWLAKKEGLKNLSFNRTRIKKLPDDLSVWKRTLQTLQLGDLDLSAAEMKRIREAFATEANTVGCAVAF